MDLEEVLLKRFRESSEADSLVLSDRTILDTIKLHGLPEEDKVDEFIEKLTPLFKTVAGQSRSILSKAKEERENELERLRQEYSKDPDKQVGVPPTDDGKNNNPNDSVEMSDKSKEVISSLHKMVEELTVEIANIKKEKSVSSRQTELEAYADSLGFSDSYVLKQAMGKLDLSKENFDELKNDLSQLYTSEYKACRDMDVPTLGSDGGKDAASSFLDSQFKKREEESKLYNQKFD